MTRRRIRNTMSTRIRTTRMRLFPRTMTRTIWMMTRTRTILRKTGGAGSVDRGRVERARVVVANGPRSIMSARGCRFLTVRRRMHRGTRRMGLRWPIRKRLKARPSLRLLCFFRHSLWTFLRASLPLGLRMWSRPFRILMDCPVTWNYSCVGR